MTDRIPGAPGRYQAMFTDGELAGKEFTVTLRRDDAPIAEGTPYNKANVLPDALAAQLCPGMEDPAPKDAFAALQEQKADTGRRKTGSQITLVDAADAPVMGLKIYGHAREDGCVGDKGSVTVKMMGKNLFNWQPEKELDRNSANLKLIEVLENGVILQGNNATGGTGGNAWSNGHYRPAGNNSFQFKAGDTVTLSCDYTMLEYNYGDQVKPVGVYLRGSENDFVESVRPFDVGVKKRISYQYTYPKDETNAQIVITCNGGKVKIENVNLEYGTLSNYEPYREPQTITVPTPGGLEGDVLMQDEVDFTKGVLIRRVFENSETPLPEEVLEAYAKLRTYAPTTIITNDEEADMEVRYCTPQTAMLVSQNHYIVEQGEWIDVSAELDPGEGTYRKLGNGLATASGTFTCVQDGMLEYSQLYSGFYEYEGRIVFPFEFAQTPVINLTLEPDSNYYQISVTKVNTKFASFKIITSSSRDISAKYNASVIGVWK